jgi:hypothetical protein
MAYAKLVTVEDVANYLSKLRSWVYGNWKARTELSQVAARGAVARSLIADAVASLA